MRVLFISRAYPPTIGGIENQNEALGRHLSAITECDLIVNRSGKKALPLFIPFTIFNALLNLKRYDIILLGDGVATPIGWFIKLFTTKPVVCILHGLDITWKNSIYQRLWVQFFFKRIDHFIAVSHSTRDIAINTGVPIKKITVIPNGVENSNIQPLPKPQLEKAIGVDLKGKFILLTLGRLIERKGVAWFVKNVLPNLADDVVYLIAGDGPDKPKVTQLINKHKLTNKAHILGTVNEQLKQTLFNHCDLFIQPNIPVEGDAEGFGITQLEAGICGLPSISSKLEGIQDAIQEDQNGWLAEPLCKDSFIKTILEKKELLTEQSTITKSHVKQYCHLHFNWPSIANRYIDTLNQITN